MARIFWDGFQGQHSQKWTEAEGEIVATSAGIGDHQTDGNGRCLKLDQNRSHKKTFGANFTETYIGFWYRTGALASNFRDGQVEYFFAYHKDVTRQIALAISNTSRKMTLYFANDFNTKIAEGTHVFADHTQFFFELRYKMAASGGYVQTWFDGALDLDYSNADTAPGVDTTFNNIHLYSPNSGGFPAYFDGLMLNDTTGGVDDGRTGIRHIWGQIPDGDSAANNAWSKSTGSNGWELVDERPPNTTDYVYTTTDAQKQGHTFSAHQLPSNASVKAVIHEHSMIKVTDGQVKVGMRQNGAEYLGATEDVATSYAINEVRRRVNPDGDVDWDLTTSDNVESLLESVIA